MSLIQNLLWCYLFFTCMKRALLLFLSCGVALQMNAGVWAFRKPTSMDMWSMNIFYQMLFEFIHINKVKWDDICLQIHKCTSNTFVYLLYSLFGMAGNCLCFYCKGMRFTVKWICNLKLSNQKKTNWKDRSSHFSPQFTP